MNLRVYFSFIILLGTFGCDSTTDKEYFDKIVYDDFHTKYDGIVVDKYISKYDHGRHVIELKNEIFGVDKIDFSFQSLELFNQIKIGDTILKERKSISLKIKRKNLDTIVDLDFGKLKGSNKYYYENPYLTKEKK